MHVQLLGPIVPGTIVPNGAHVPGTCHVLDPVAAAFSMGTAAAWLDFNDAWLAAEWCGGEGGTGGGGGICGGVDFKSLSVKAY